MTIVWRERTETYGGKECPVWFCVVDLSLKDSKGRAIGTSATVTPSMVKSDSGGFFVQLWALRDGRAFGALRRSTKYATLKEAKAGAEKKLAVSAKRYARLVAERVI